MSLLHFDNLPCKINFAICPLFRWQYCRGPGTVLMGLFCTALNNRQTWPFQGWALDGVHCNLRNPTSQQQVRSIDFNAQSGSCLWTSI